MVAVTDASVTHESGYSETIGEQLVDIAGVEKVFYTMGDVDFVVISRVRDREQLNGLIDEMVAIEGVNETSSRFVMQEFETNSSVVGNLSTAMEAAVLDSQTSLQ